MRLWRLVASRFADQALNGEGAALYGGRWNPVGTRLVYTADSLALATLELVVHLAGGRMAVTAIELDLADRWIDRLEVSSLKRGWRSDEASTQRAGQAWLASGRSVALAVPSVLVEPRSGERTVILNPAHAQMPRVREVQRFEVLLDERL